MKLVPGILLAACFCALLVPGCGTSTRTARCFLTSEVNTATLPDISIDPLDFEENGRPRLDVMFQIPYKKLSFMRSDNDFTAQYTVSVTVLDDDGVQVGSQDWSNTITVRDYRETTSDRSDATIRAFRLPAGTYTLRVSIQDDQTEQKHVVRRRITLRSASHEITASDIVILQRVSDRDSIKVITPMLPSDIRKVRDFSTFQEVYDSTMSDTIRVITQIIPFSLDIDERIQSSPYVFSPIIPTSELFAPKYDSVWAEHDTLLVSGKIPIQLFNTFRTPAPGRYQLVSRIMHKKPNGIDTMFYGRILTIRPEFFPDIADVESEIGPLRYVLRKNVFDTLDAPGTQDVKARRLDHIWNTILNPSLRQDFYNRVRQANDYFTTFVDGWRTPMGMVYIVAGPPTDVDCQGSVSETWSYDYQQGYAIFLFQTNGTPQQGPERPYYSLLRYPVQDVWQSFVDRWKR